MTSQLKQMFSVYLSKGAGSVGNIQFGGMDLAKYSKAQSEDDVVWVNTVDDGWTIPMGGVGFRDGGQLHIKGEQATLDTGLTYVMAPPDDLDELAARVKGDTGIACTKEGGGEIDLMECDCTKDQFKKLKPLQLNIAGKAFNMPVEAWMSFEEKQRIEQDESDAVNLPQPKNCRLLMYPYDISMTATYKWVLGVQFLQNFYTIYDPEKKRIGLVESKDA